MSNLTRKDFLRLSSWAVVATLLPIGKLNAIASISSGSPTPTAEDFKKAQSLAKQAKTFFRQKDFQKAERLYLQCIKLAPKAICFYDSLENVYGAKSDLVSSVELYRQGLLLNPKKVAFFDRSARSLMRLELGNRKEANKYKGKINSSSLLKDAETLLAKAKTIDSSKKYLTISLNKVSRKKERKSTGNKHTFAKLCKEDKKTNRKRYKKVFELKKENEIVGLLNKVDSKKRVSLYNTKEIEHQKKQIVKQKKRYSRILLSRIITPGSAERSVLAEQIFDLDTSDPTSLITLKKEYHKTNRFADFITARQKFADKKQTFTSNLGLMDAVEKAYKKKQISFDDSEKAVTIGNEMFANWPLLEKERVDVAHKLSKIYLLQNRHNEAKSILEETTRDLSTSTSSVVNKLIFSYANVFYSERNFEQAKSILLAGINETELIDENYKSINTIAKNRKGETFKDKTILFYLLHKVYKALDQNADANQVLEKLLSNNPNDQFVLTRK